MELIKANTKDGLFVSEILKKEKKIINELIREIMELLVFSEQYVENSYRSLTKAKKKQFDERKPLNNKIKFDGSLLSLNKFINYIYNIGACREYLFEWHLEDIHKLLIKLCKVTHLFKPQLINKCVKFILKDNLIYYISTDDSVFSNPEGETQASVNPKDAYHFNIMDVEIELCSWRHVEREEGLYFQVTDYNNLEEDKIYYMDSNLFSVYILEEKACELAFLKSMITNDEIWIFEPNNIIKRLSKMNVLKLNNEEIESVCSELEDYLEVLTINKIEYELKKQQSSNKIKKFSKIEIEKENKFDLKEVLEVKNKHQKEIQIISNCIYCQKNIQEIIRILKKIKK